MLKLLKPARNISKNALSRCQCSTSSNNKPPEAKKDEKTELTSKKYDPTEVTKEDLQWRTPWHQREAQYFSALRTFYSENNNRSVLQMIQTPIDLSPTGMKNWWTKRKEKREILMQSYLPERNRMLGNDLAAAHFLVHRGGAVKFHGENSWIKANIFNEYKLPRFYEEDKHIQAIDCSNVNLYFEGLENFRDLRKIQWARFDSCENLDDWCMDRITNIFSHSLLYLDIRNCPNITERGIGAVYKMRNLKILLIDDVLMSSSYEMTCLLLQEANPQLDIRTEDYDIEDPPPKKLT